VAVVGVMLVMRRFRMFGRRGIRHSDRRFRSCLGGQPGVFLMTMRVIMLLVAVLFVVMVPVLVVRETMVVVVMILMLVVFSGMVGVTVVMRMPGFAAIQRTFDQLRLGRMQFCLGHLMLGFVVADRRFRGQRRIGVGTHDVTLDPLAMAAATRTAMPRASAAGPVLALLFRLAMGTLFGLDQGLTIRHRDLVVVGVDFAESKKPMAIAAIFDESGLQGWLYPRDLGEIDVAAQLLALGGLEIKLFDAIATDHNDPGLFRVSGIDQHFVWHFQTLGGGGRV
jgi:hypothetical protein